MDYKYVEICNDWVYYVIGIKKLFKFFLEIHIE